MQLIISNALNGHIILLLSSHKHRSISPLGHKSMIAFKECSLISTSTFGASLQKQNPAKVNKIYLVFLSEIKNLVPGLHPINVMRLPRRSSLNEIGPLVKLPADEIVIFSCGIGICRSFLTDLERGHTHTCQHQKGRNFPLFCPGSPLKFVDKICGSIPSGIPTSWPKPAL